MHPSDEACSVHTDEALVRSYTCRYPRGVDAAGGHKAVPEHALILEDAGCAVLLRVQEAAHLHAARRRVADHLAPLPAHLPREEG